MRNRRASAALHRAPESINSLLLLSNCCFIRIQYSLRTNCSLQDLGGTLQRNIFPFASLIEECTQISNAERVLFCCDRFFLGNFLRFLGGSAIPRNSTETPAWLEDTSARFDHELKSEERVARERNIIDAYNGKCRTQNQRPPNEYMRYKWNGAVRFRNHSKERVTRPPSKRNHDDLSKRQWPDQLVFYPYILWDFDVIHEVQ